MVKRNAYVILLWDLPGPAWFPVCASFLLPSHSYPKGRLSALLVLRTNLDLGPDVLRWLQLHIWLPVWFWPIAQMVRNLCVLLFDSWPCWPDFYLSLFIILLYTDRKPTTLPCWPLLQPKITMAAWNIMFSQKAMPMLPCHHLVLKLDLNDPRKGSSNLTGSCWLTLRT